jgi:hypothetical protein
MTLSMREQLIQEILKMNDTEIAALMGTVLSMRGDEKPLYDETKDVAIGLFDGPEDLSARVKDILRDDTKRRGSWTVKDKG